MIKNKYHLHEERKCSVRHYYIPKMKTLPIILASILFFLMFVIVLVLTLTRNNSLPGMTVTNQSNEIEVTEKATTKVPNYQGDFLSLIVEANKEPKCSIPNDCNIVCIMLNSSEIVGHVNQLSFGSSSDICSNNIKLTLEDIIFENSTMSNGWIAGLRYSIRELEISCETLYEFGEQAFADEPLSALEILTVSNSNIWTLRKHSFEGSSFTTFQFRRSTSSLKGISAEEDALGALANKLITLQFNYCINDSEAIKNITGRGTIFSQLLSLDLRNNDFTFIPNQTFSKAVNLKSLFLNQNSITAIEIGAFTGIETISQLFINKNMLETMPEGVFTNFNSVNGEINIEHNFWRCNCDLVWLRDFYEASKYFTNPTVDFLCYENGNHIKYSLVDFCPNDNNTRPTFLTEITTKTFTTTSSYGVPTIPPPTNSYREIICENFTKANLYQLLGPDTGVSYSRRVQVLDRGVTFDLYQVDELPHFKVFVQGRIGSDYILWTNVLNQSDYGCVFNVSDFVYLKLQFGQTYTLCLSKFDSVITSTDCTALTVPLKWGEQTWIPNKQMSALIGVFITTATIAIFITSFCSYYIIRQNPYLIQGNKRVIILKNQKQQKASVMPNYYCKQKAFSVYTNSEGYLTPKNKHYSKIKRETCKGLDTITENFMREFDDFSSECPSPCPEDFYEDIPPPHPPPLPPNHPSERRGSEFNPYFYSNL